MHSFGNLTLTPWHYSCCFLSQRVKMPERRLENKIHILMWLKKSNHKAMFSRYRLLELNFKKNTKAKSWTIMCHFESFIYWHSQSLSHLNISEDWWMATVFIWLPFSICHWSVNSSEYDYFNYASYDKERNKSNRNNSEFCTLYTETIRLFQGHIHIFLIFYFLHYKNF